jgi:hypothetical protein
MSISRLLEKLARIQSENGDREIVLSHGGDDFEIVAIAPLFIFSDEPDAPVLLELQPVARQPAAPPAAATRGLAREELPLRVA